MMTGDPTGNVSSCVSQWRAGRQGVMTVLVYLISPRLIDTDPIKTDLISQSPGPGCRLLLGGGQTH